MYLIFAPTDAEKEKEALQSGLNVNIPQATDNKLTDDKQKAYEFSSDEKKNKDRERAIGTLAEMYSSENTNEPDTENSNKSNTIVNNNNESSSHIDRSVREYQAASQAVSNFMKMIMTTKRNRCARNGVSPSGTKRYGGKPIRGRKTVGTT